MSTSGQRHGQHCQQVSSAGDTLNFTSQNGITGSYNAATGVLTLTGSSTVAHYQAALESITYSSSSSNPTNNGTDTSRTISFVANDGTLNSNTLSSTVTVTGVDQPPVLSNGGNTVNYTQGGTAAVIDASLGATDPDSTNLASATVSITGGFLAGDTLTFATQNGITGSYNAATGVLTLSGSSTVARYQAALESITFSSSSSNPTSFGTDTGRTISFVASDGTLNSNSLSSTVTVTGVDQAPVLSNGGNTVNYTEGGAAAVLDAALGTTDPDSTNLASATVSITGNFLAGDTLNFTNQNGITGSYNTGIGVLTLTGGTSLANYKAALESITFSSSSQNPTNFGADTSRTISSAGR